MKSCNVGVDPGAPALPVAGSGVLSGVRKSRHARWRAIVLATVHLLILLHAAHFLIAGRTLSPVEPSESMYTLELGQVNAGFLFFAAALLSTLVFGRFFCGWGCHLVALQDLCAWIMKRAGIRPKPFRSRLLLLGPMVLALYMFVWPTVKRVLFAPSSGEFPGFTDHLMTTGFWDTFPGPLFAILTLASCGFAAVYLLGSKGFCTYGCPYGAFFGVADRFSVGRILVSDDCDQCGHCTVTCTSNVIIHREVRDFGMVVDPGCMKCTDCVSVCPKGALRFGFALPARHPKAGAERRPRRSQGVWQEIFLALIALLSTLAFRGLYDGPPLLMAIGLGAMTAYLALQAVRVAGRPDVKLQNLILKRQGRVTKTGSVVMMLVTGWLLFAVHSGFVQWHRFQGRRLLEATEVTRAQVFGRAPEIGRPSAEHTRAQRGMAHHFGVADRWGLFPTVEVKLGLAWDRLLDGDTAASELYLREAAAVESENLHIWGDLFEVALLANEPEVAIEALARLESLRSVPTDLHCRLARTLAAAEQTDLAIEHYTVCVEGASGSLEAHYNLGGLLRRAGRFEGAVAQLEYARALAPADFDVHVELGLAYAAVGRKDQAIAMLRRAIELAPERPESLYHLPGVIRELENR